ncbi:hypothetical protein [Luteimonas sp. FCS-9]|uniref:hypothetical protein n=1 Tax=Luteimonas sp. FCS-9 TaxID=1547516 RepID=UPI0012E00696|nr:hypothetical protein [Luteimonas sp. FCS-9]
MDKPIMRASSSVVERDAAHTPALTQPGREVAGSRVRFPLTAVRGTSIEGLAPPGSRIQTGADMVVVGHDGRVVLRTPDSTGDWTLQVHRPGHQRTLPIRIHVLADE